MKEKRKKIKEECPLCEVSEETLKRLREGADKKTKESSKDNNESKR